jgi:putative endonuclease
MFSKQIFCQAVKRKELGNIGENIATEHLLALNFKILERNFRCRMGEIDIIAKKGGDLYFVEVKTRRSRKFGSPLESVTLNKQRQIVKIAKYFLMRFKKPVSCHFSTIGIILDEVAGPLVEFLPDAFQTA